jgi:ABC-type xylose transport system permease subunit
MLLIVLMVVVIVYPFVREKLAWGRDPLIQAGDGPIKKGGGGD